MTTDIDVQRTRLLEAVATIQDLAVPDELNDAQRRGLFSIRQFLAIQRSTIDVGSSFVYRGPSDLLLREGEVFANVASRRELVARKLRVGDLRMCYANAARLALDHPGDLTYIEGYAAGGVIDVPHAAVVDRKGKVYDVTWPWGADEYHRVENAVFLAVRVPYKLLQLFWKACGAADFLGDYYHRHPALHCEYTKWSTELVETYQRLLVEHCAHERPEGLATRP